MRPVRYLVTRRSSDEALLASVAHDRHPPIANQLPVLLLFTVSLLMALTLPSVVITSVTAVVWSVILIAVASAIAAVLPRIDPQGRYVLLVPAIDFVVIGVFRYGTGESASIFASLSILPVMWMASAPQRYNVLYAFLGVCTALLIPFLLGASLADLPAELARSLFSAMAFGLAAAVVNDLARLSRAHIRDLRARERATAEELEQASEVQRALQPTAGAHLEGYEFAGVCFPSRKIGGDFFDWYSAGGGIAFTLGDVMGKGMGAGIIAATVRAVVRSARSHDDLAVALDRASETLSSDLAATASFATMFHARLDESTGTVRYIDAGHGLTLHVRRDGTWSRLASGDLPVGIASDEPWTLQQLRLQPGDTLISCSDGILDLYDGSVDSLRHIAYIVSQSSDAANVLTRLSALIDDATTRDDDITLLVLNRLHE